MAFSTAWGILHEKLPLPSNCKCVEVGPFFSISPRIRSTSLSFLICKNPTSEMIDSNCLDSTNFSNFLQICPRRSLTAAICLTTTPSLQTFSRASLANSQILNRKRGANSKAWRSESSIILVYAGGKVSVVIFPFVVRRGVKISVVCLTLLGVGTCTEPKDRYLLSSANLSINDCKSRTPQ